MAESLPRPFETPAAWKATEFRSKDDLAVDLGPVHVDALLGGLERLKSSFPGGTFDPATATAADFPLDAVAADVAAWRRAVREGCGMVLLRGFPVDGIDLDDLRLMFLGFGTHFGRPVSQSAMGDFVGDVVGVGGKDRRERAYRSSRALNLHTDRCDHVGMLCIRPAIEGGLSGYASALTIHNIMLRERPDLLALLYRGYFHHRFGEQPPGEPPVTRERIPIFSMADGVPTAIYIRGYIDLAAQEGHVTLSAAEKEALDYLDAVADRPEVRLDFRMDRGEATITNNCVLLHTRTAFEDADDPALKRHLLRLWLREDERPISAGAALHKGRSGIERRKGKGTYYTPAA